MMGRRNVRWEAFTNVEVHDNELLSVSVMQVRGIGVLYYTGQKKMVVFINKKYCQGEAWNMYM